MFSWLKRDTSSLDDVFSRFVRPELLAELHKEIDRPLNQLQMLEQQIVLIAIEGETHGQMAARIGVSVEIARTGNWWIDMLAGLVMLSDGLPYAGKPEVKTRIALVEELQAALGSNIRLIHGHGCLPWGNYGSPNRKAFGPLIPDLLSLLGQLQQLPAGAAVDISHCLTPSQKGYTP